MEPVENDVLIVGAGVAGLTLGLVLGEKGHRVTVLDQRPGIESLCKPELIQPAGLQILHTLGLLEKLQGREVARCELFEFFKVRGRQLCGVDYRALAHPFPYALVAFPHLTQSTLLQEISACPTVRIRWGCTLTGLVRSGARSVEAIFLEDGRTRRLIAQVVVGADGKFSRVREAAGIRAAYTEYRDAFVGCLVRRPSSWPDSVRYYLGRRQILGIFPASPDQLCLLLMVPADGFHALMVQGLPALKARMAAILDRGTDLLDGVSDWGQVSYMACRAVRVSSWVKDGVVLIGDAAHACHPHVAQGTTQAMLDVMALSPVLDHCLEEGVCTSDKLSAYEKARRPTVETLQRIAHEYAWLWNAGNPVLGWLRDRIFSEIGRQPGLLRKVMETEAGIRVAPLSIFERLQVLGVWP
jgi:6-methylpretetramide 4-monooxygenase